MSCYTCTMNKGNETLTVARKKDSEAAWTVLETSTMDATSSAVPLFSFPTRTMAVTPEHEQQEDDEDQQDKDNTRTRVFDFQEGTRMLQDASGEHSISNSRRRHDSFSRSHTDAASYDVVSIHSSIDSEEQEQDDDDKPHHETQLQLQIRLQLDRMTSFLYSSPSSSLTKHANVNNASSTSIISEIDSHYHDHHHSLMTSMNMDSRNISMSIGTPEKTYTTLPSLPESDVFFLPSEIASLSCYSHPLTTSGISEIDDDDDDNSASFLFSQEEDLPVPVDEYDEDKKTMLTIQPRPPLSEIPIPSMIMPHTSNQHNIQKFARETRTRATVNNSNKKWINNNTFQSKKQHERLTLQHPDVAPTTRTNLKPKSPSELSSPESTSTRNLKFDLVDDEDRSSKNKSQTSLKAHDRHEDQIIALSTSMAALEICDAIAEASLNVTMVTPEHPQQDSLSSPCSSDDSLSCPTHKNHMMMDIRDDPSPLLFSCATCGVQEETIRRQQEDIGYYQLILNQVLAHLQHTVQGGDENKNQVHDAAGDFKKGKQQHPSAPYLSIDVKATEKMIHDLQLASDHATASHHHSPTQKHTDHEPRASTMLLYNHDPPNSGDLCLLSTPVTIRNHVVQDHEEFFHGLPMEGGQAPMRGDYQGHTPPSPILKQIELASFDPELKPYAAFNSAGDPDAEQVAPRGLEEQATAALTSASVMENAAVLPKHNQFPVEVDTELPGLSQLQPTACVSEHENQDSVSGSLFIVDMPNEDSHEQEGSASISKYRRSSASVPEHSRAGEDWEKQTREVQERMTLLQTDTENACRRVEELETQKTEANRRITVSQGIILSLRQANLEVKSSKVQVDTELEGLQSKHSELEAQLHASDKQVKTLHVGKETLGTRVHELESQATELKALVDEKIELLQSLQYEKAATSDAHAALEIAIRHAKSQLQVSNEDTRQANNDKEDLAAQSSELESALEEAKTKSIDLECQLKESQGTTDSLRAEIETRTSYIEQKEAASAETSKRLEDAHNKCAQLEDLLKDTQGEVTAFGAMITSKESKIEELESSMIKKERLGDGLKMHLQLLRIEKGSLESQLAELEDEKDETKFQLEGVKAESIYSHREKAKALCRVSEFESTRGESEALRLQLESRNDELQEHLEESESDIKTIAAEKEAASIHIARLLSETAELKKSSQETNFALVVLEEYLSDTLDEIASLKLEREALHSQMADKETAVTGVESRLEDMEKQIGDLNKTTGDTSKELERVEAEALALKTLNEALLKRSQRVENDKIASDALAELIRSKHAKLESKLLESNARMTALLVQIEGIGSPNEAFESSCGSVPVLHSASKESADNEDFWGRIEQAIASKSFREKAKADSKLQELARMKDDAQNMLHKTEFKLAEGQSQLKIADDKTRDLATELAASHAQVGRTQEASDNLKIRLAEVESQKIEVEGRLESMDGFVGFLEAEKLILSFSAKDMELEKRRVQFLLQESESQTTALEIQFKEQKQSYDMVCADKQDKEVRIEELLLEKGSIEAELGRTKEEIASLKSENASFTMKVGNLKGTNEKLQTELDKTRKEVGVFRVVIVMLQAQQQTLSLAKLEAYASFKEATEKNTEVSERLRGAEQQISVLRAELSASTLQGIALSREKKELEEVSGAGKRRPKSELQGRLSDFDAEIPAIERDDNSRVMDSHVVENGKERGISSSASSSSEPRLDKGEFATFSPKPQVASLSTPTSLEKVASRVRQMEIELDLYYLDDKFYKQKAKYSGALRHGLPDGMGVLWFESGDLYVGEFHLGEMHGVGAFNHKRRDHHRKQLKSKHQIFKGGFVHNEFVGPLPPIRRVLVSKIPDSPIRNNEGTKSSQSTPKNTPRANLSECSDSDRSSAITSGARKLLNPTRIHKATFGL